jgi:ABC-2 type transport system ATP-binding protein
MQPILEIQKLRKQYSSVEAVRDVSFSVASGICFGLLGPNGAGKTTTMEIIENIIEPTGGEILYSGHPRTGSFREEIGIQFQHTSLLNFLTVEETLVTFARLFRDPADLEEIISRCDLASLRKQRNNRLSGGQAQRLMLALALINRPRLIFLDEPSTGLDPQSRRNLWDIVMQLKLEGRTLLLTTHSMEEAEYLCDEIAIMDQGTIIASGTPDDLIRRYGGMSSIILPSAAFLQPLDTLPFSAEKRDDGMIIIRTEEIHQGLNILMAQNIDLRGVSIHSPDLEDVFLHLTGKKLRE